MPIKITPPRHPKAKSLWFRGSYLGISVDKSAGTPKRAVAERLLKQLEGQIERGEYPPKEVGARRQQPITFVEAAVAYLEDEKPKRYVKKLIDYFGETAIFDIDQDVLNEAAAALYPNTSGANRNRSFFTPALAIMHHAGDKRDFERPAGAKGKVLNDFLTPDDAFAIIEAADGIDAEYGLYLRFLLYTGTRVGEPLKITWDKVMLDEGAAWLPTSKNDDPRMLRLRDDLRDALARHRPEKATGRVFRFRQGGHHKHLLTRAKLAALGLDCPVRRPTGWRQPPNRLAKVNHKTFRHTWATWMRRYAGLDLQGLVATNNWRDPRSAARYAHVVEREEWSRVDRLPDMGKIRGSKAS